MLPLGWGLVSTYDLGSFPFPYLLFVNDDLLIFNNVRAKANQRMIWICDIEQNIQEKSLNKGSLHILFQFQFSKLSRWEIRKGWNHRGTSQFQSQTSSLFRWSLEDGCWNIWQVQALTIREDLIKHLQSLEELFKGKMPLYQRLAFPKLRTGRCLKRNNW